MRRVLFLLVPVVLMIVTAGNAYGVSVSDLTAQLFASELKIPDGSLIVEDPLPFGHTIHVVDRDNKNSWKIHVSSGTVTFEEDRCSATSRTPLPPGAAHLLVFPGAGPLTYARERATRYHRTYLRDLTRLDYWACDRRNNGGQWPFIALEIDYTHDNQIDDELIFEPLYQNPIDGGRCGVGSNQPRPIFEEWQFWDGLREDPITHRFQGCWWSVENTALFPPGAVIRPLSEYIDMFPDAAIVNLDGNHGGLQMMHGFSEPSDTYDGYIDAVTVGKDLNKDAGQTDNSTITYDFECNRIDDPTCPTS
jgi:hypothetical protein